MIWWLHARAIPLVAATVVGAFLAALLVGRTAIPVPNLAGPAGELLVVQLLGAAPVLMLLHGIERGDTAAEAVAVRSARMRNLALCLTLTVTCSVAAAVLRVAVNSSECVSLARNVAGFLGVALLIRGIAGPALASVVVAVLPLLCAAAGWGPGGRPYAWAWPVHPANSHVAIVEAFVLLVLGCTMVLLREQPIVTVQRPYS
ncbi:hypothetical protein AB0I68_04395 [Streptomyces sp. NPDC050448]|uniref:hypothetical protein n=1 Tax=Streptomyces sp. NPDC050448 TaxID=3155404 RepID=UPI003444C828